MRQHFSAWTWPAGLEAPVQHFSDYADSWDEFLSSWRSSWRPEFFGQDLQGRLTYENEVVHPKKWSAVYAKYSTMSPDDPLYGGWTFPRLFGPSAKLHYFPSPVANSACSRYKSSEREPLPWAPSTETRDKCLRCERTKNGWDKNNTFRGNYRKI